MRHQAPDGASGGGGSGGGSGGEGSKHGRYHRRPGHLTGQEDADLRLRIANRVLARARLMLPELKKELDRFKWRSLTNIKWKSPWNQNREPPTRLTVAEAARDARHAHGEAIRRCLEKSLSKKKLQKAWIENIYNLNKSLYIVSTLQTKRRLHQGS